MDIQNSCGSLIKQIHDELEKQGNNAMRPQGLTMAQLGVLLALYGAEGKQLPLKELEGILHVAQSTTAGIVARLEQKAFVEGFGSANDRRIKMVRIGLLCCQEAERSMEAAEGNILSALTETERAIFQALLRKVRDSLQ
jgi:DNA-binding MarR family transcriptional regulator